MKRCSGHRNTFAENLHKTVGKVLNCLSRITNFIVASFNQAEIAAIQVEAWLFARIATLKASVDSKLVWDCVRKFTLGWVPSHKAVKGN